MDAITLSEYQVGYVVPFRRNSKPIIAMFNVISNRHRMRSPVDRHVYFLQLSCIIWVSLNSSNTTHLAVVRKNQTFPIEKATRQMFLKSKIWSRPTDRR